VPTGNLEIDYSGGTYVNEALNKIAEAAGVEWWMEGMTVNISRAEHVAYGDDVIGIELGYNNGLQTIERDNADNVEFFTRLFPIGSSRNIDYETYGHSRLQLPSGAKYVERNADKYGVVERYEEDAFSHIYPRRTGFVSFVRSEVVPGDNGDFTIYYFKDQGLNFDPNNYEIGGMVKQIVFQTGNLAGRDFEVNYNSSTQEFEIITEWPYDDDTQIPGGLLVPQIGDTYILYNIRMPAEYYPLAEAEYAEAVALFLEDHSGLTDRSVYKCKTNYIELDEMGVTLTIGQRVRLFSDRFFPTLGYRDSRITRISRNVDRPNEADIEISDVLSKTTQSSMQGDIANIRTEIRTGTATFPDIIRSWDNTLPTDNNIFSARRSLRESLSRKNNDSAAGLLRFLAGAQFGDYEQGTSGAAITPTGTAELLSIVVRQILRSSVFVDGLTGEGWALWKDLTTGLSCLTVDKLTVRQTMTVFELLINKIRSVGGQIIVSAANGKIKDVALTEDAQNYVISFEDENTFLAHDLVRCQTFTGASLKSYWVEVAEVDGANLIVPLTEFAGEVPAAGDELVLMGNIQNTARQNLISIAATEDGQPRIDILNGVNSKSFSGCLRARLGNLDGIQDSWFPLDNQPHGDGLYADNAYLRGTFLLVTGEDIKTKFEITEGLIRSAVEGVRQDLMDGKSYLANPSFSDGMAKWNTTNEAVFFLVGNKWIWLNNNIYSKKGDFAAARQDGGRSTVYIKNRYILQTNDNMHSKPEFTPDETGQCQATPVYLTFFYRVAAAGTLRVEFENVDKTGFDNFNSFEIEQYLDVTDEYLQFTADGLWNGTGDFRLSFTGEIYLYMLVLSTDRVLSLTQRYQTLFEQSEKLVRIAAENFDADGNVLASSQIVTTAEMNAMVTGINLQISDMNNAINSTIAAINNSIDGLTGSIATLTGSITDINTEIGNMASMMVTQDDMALMVSGIYDEVGNMIQGAGFVTTASLAGMFVINSDGELVSMVGATAEGVFIKADAIQLEGLVTANENFKILEDGSIEAVNASLTGSVTAISGKIGGFSITETGLTNTPFGSDNEAYIIFRDDPHQIFAGIGTNVLPSSSGLMAAARFENGNTADVYGTNIAAYVSASGGAKNYALYLGNGCIGGFAVACKQINSNTTLTNADCIISCYNTATITLTIGTPANVGKIYYIRLNNSASVVIDPYTSGGKQLMDVNGSTNNQLTATTRGELITLIWDGQYWLYSTTAS
jgi:hypothetical protein